MCGRHTWTRTSRTTAFRFAVAAENCSALSIACFLSLNLTGRIFCARCDATAMWLARSDVGVFDVDEVSKCDFDDARTDRQTDIQTDR